MSKTFRVKKEKIPNSECLFCKKPVYLAAWRMGRGKYCSLTCSGRAQRTEKSYSSERTCKGCSKKFLPTQWYQKWCNRKCFTDSVRKSRDKECLACKKQFRQVRKAQKYCSRECGKPYKDNYTKKPKQETLDHLWSKYIKLRAGNKCEVCEKGHGLNSHHIFSRSNHTVRWDIENGICVCVAHHIFGLFSAHKSPIEFAEWLKEKRGLEWYEALRQRARERIKFSPEDKELIKANLKKLIEEYQLKLEGLK